MQSYKMTLLVRREVEGAELPEQEWHVAFKARTEEEARRAALNKCYRDRLLVSHVSLIGVD